MDSLPSAVVSATEVRYVTSSNTNQEYRVSIALPYAYGDKDAADKKYPTIYVLDGNWFFEMVTAMTRLMSGCGSVPEVIVVGIGYPTNDSYEAESFNEQYSHRSRDLTPVRDKVWEGKVKERMAIDHMTTGGAAQFLKFLKKELIPIVETEYRVDIKNKILAGLSMGGLFVLYALFHEADLFQGFVAASPSTWFGDRHIFSIEDNYAQKQNDLVANLYLSIGQKEETEESRMVSSLFRLSALLESRDYKGLTLKNQVFEDLNHCDAGVPGFQLGLKWIFSLSKPETNK